jgi:hypothetical protein
MSSLLLEGPISPELVLVAPAEEARDAREALPDVTDFYLWIQELRALVEPVADESDVRGAVTFGAITCLAAIAPLVLVILARLLA